MPLLLWAVLLAGTPDTHEVTGQVLDSKSRPVADARVILSDQRGKTEVATDAKGNFTLKSSLTTPAFLFVEKAGFRFHGQRQDKPGNVQIQLTRRDEPATARMPAQPARMPLEKRKKLAAEVLEPLVKNLAKASEDARLRPLKMLARVDPGRALEELDNRPFKSAWYDGYIRRAAVGALRDNREEAASIADSIKDAGFRTFCQLDLHDATPATQKAERLKYLNFALVASQGETKNDHRILHLGRIARRLHALGEKERATKLLREGQEIAKKLPTDGWAAYARGAFAEELALIDLPAALALMKDLKDSLEHIRHHGNLAQRLATSNSAEAVRIIDLLAQSRDTQRFQLDQYSIRVCHGLATSDLARARKVADAIVENSYRARALANMADALAQSRPKEALALLDESNALLAKRVASGKDSFNNYSNAASLVGLSVGIAERIDPKLVPEFFWKAVSLHPGRFTLKDDPWGHHLGAVAALALTLGRYDRELALVLLESAGPPSKNATHHHDSLIRTAAVLDPPRAIAMLGKRPDDRQTEYVRSQVIDALLTEPAELSRLIHHALAEWHVDDEDL